jgi:hypothetical protein
MAATDMHVTTEELLEALFSVRSLPRLYKEGQLPLEGVSRCSKGTPNIKKVQTLPFYQRRNNERRRRKKKQKS